MKFKKILKLFIVLFIISIIIYSSYPEKKLTKNAEIDKIIVLKSKRELKVFSKEILLKTYKISLGSHPNGKKEFEGDKKTPEGLYFINDKNLNSGYHKNLGISYPNKNDIERAKILNKPPGGHIKIHGLKNKTGFIGKFHRFHDWTLGCIAVTNDEIDELFNSVKIGTPIEIKP